MIENHLVWTSVADLESRYFVRRKDGTVEKDFESREIIRRKFTALLSFFSKNNLLTVEAFDVDGNFIDREFRRNDFTAEGFALVKMKVANWIESKGSQKNPPDMKLLEKALAVIRSSSGK